MFYGHETNAISSSIIERCIAEYCVYDGITIHEDAEEYVVGSDNIIRNCVSHHNGEQGYDISSGTGTVLQDSESYSNTGGWLAINHSAVSTVVERCKSTNEQGAVIAPHTGDGGAILRNNYIDSTGHDIAISIGTGANGYTLYHNTIIATPTAINYAPLRTTSDGVQVTATNNIIVSTVSDYPVLRVDYPDYFTSSYNDYYGGSASPFRIDSSNINFASFDALDCSTNDLTSDPLLSGFKISTSSPCRGAGTDVG